MQKPSRPLRLGTRGSPLALAQAHMTVAALRARHGWDEGAVEIVVVQTSGDRIQDRALADIGGKALWTKELDRALASGEIDFAVHSMKDVETIRPAEIRIAAMLPRADVRDRLVGADDFAALPERPVVGTSSPRRAAQVRRLRPDAQVVLFRGNVATRLARLDRGEAHATLLAAAGLDRLGQGDVGVAIPVDVMLPAPSQGAVGIETLSGDEAMLDLLAAISDADTFDCVMAERAVLAGLGGTCHSPIAAFARLEDGQVRLRAEIISPDGRETVGETARIERGDAAAAEAMGRGLLDRASPALRLLFEA
ncbi:porphobilinogen deaminase [Sphingobium sp. TA15]|uniref:Porphobilinogen deaminase n=1 Tax=Sphingobium indicum (strain DSM 16413 / CCM 7287 / MTCC 6362 / UT26 / NBRC 101211 / UT26S) TaxID=452662 RepID=D4YXR8_SPHIU|nr:hydroxymethylbilane synthase [Sphingobium indicum]BAI95150.1 hydroxymethylbilane synthase [Sphingobium indicum UT26S]BDD68028.1 porphobilinogen deaminase [Sphingobium sp. TA15]